MATLEPTEPPAKEPNSDSANETNQTTKVLSAIDLFGGAREIVIDHDGEFYRLRITRRGKLILQK